MSKLVKGREAWIYNGKTLVLKFKISTVQRRKGLSPFISVYSFYQYIIFRNGGFCNYVFTLEGFLKYWLIGDWMRVEFRTPKGRIVKNPS